MHSFAVTLLSCYAISFLSVIWYFVKEDSIVHYSRRIESFYLNCVLSLIYFCSIKFGLHFFGYWNGQLKTPEDPVIQQNVLQSQQTIRHVLLVLILLTIAQKFVAIGILPRFYDNPGYRHTRREAKLWRIAVQHPKAVRIAGEVNDMVDSIVGLDPVPVMDFVPTAFVVLVLLLISELACVVEGFWYVAISVGDLCQTVTILVAVILMVRRCMLLGARVEALNELMEDLVRERRKPYLTYILATVSVPTLMEVSNNMLGILTEQALNDDLLDTSSRAIVIDALQRAGLRSRRRQNAVCRLIANTYGTDLNKLKNIIDSRGGYHNLYKLVYEDITDLNIRKTVLAHIGAEGALLQQARERPRGIKVLSDMDDTLFSSGGHFPAGCDRRFPKGVVYPGVLTLFKVLDKTFDPQRPTCNIVFLSARPHIYKNWMEEKSYNLFQELQEQERLHTFPTLLPGQLCSGLKALLAHCCNRRQKTFAWREVGMNKVTMFLNYLRLYKEYDLIFCGDDGQGDLLAAQHMLEQESSLCADSSETGSELDEDTASHEHTPLQLLQGRQRRGVSAILDETNVQCEDSNELEENEDPPSSRSSGDSQSSEGDSLDSSEGGVQDGREGRLRAVLIHQVVFQDNCPPLAREEPEARDEAWSENLRRHNLIFHRSYVGAAMELHLSLPDLVTLEDLESIAQDAVQEFEEVRLMYPETSWRWEETEVDLARDIERVNEALRAAGRPELRHPRGTVAIEASDNEEGNGVARHVSTLSARWIDSGGLAGAGELRKNFVDLMPKAQKVHRRRRPRHRTARSSPSITSA